MLRRALSSYRVMPILIVLAALICGVPYCSEVLHSQLLRSKRDIPLECMRCGSIRLHVMENGYRCPACGHEYVRNSEDTERSNGSQTR